MWHAGIGWPRLPYPSIIPLSELQMPSVQSELLTAVQQAANKGRSFRQQVSNVAVELYRRGYRPTGQRRPSTGYDEDGRHIYVMIFEDVPGGGHIAVLGGVNTDPEVVDADTIEVVDERDEGGSLLVAGAPWKADQAKDLERKIERDVKRASKAMVVDRTADKPKRAAPRSTPRPRPAPRKPAPAPRKAAAPRAEASEAEVMKAVSEELAKIFGS